MKNNSVLFFGVFGSLALSWAALVLGGHLQSERLGLHYDSLENAAYPTPMPGLAARGQLVYQELGCGACHTQQVRRKGAGHDMARGWGVRQSVTRDYMLQSSPQLGQTRVGPDLANFGARAEKDGFNAAKLHERLHQGGRGMPSYSFLYEDRALVGERSNRALSVATKPGRQIVATERADALVAYLLSLRQEQPLPEAPVEEATTP